MGYTMIYNKDYLFIHIPRSGGKCLKSCAIPFLEKPIYLAQKFIDEKFFNKDDFIRINESLVHSSLDEIEHLKKAKNRAEIKGKRLNNMFWPHQDVPDLKQIKSIVVCLRNSLDRAKSLYKHQCFLKKYKEDFETFTGLLGKDKLSKFFSNTKNYCTINNELPENITFIKFDSLQEDLCKLLNTNEIDIKSKKHNEIFEFNEFEEKRFFGVTDINKVITNINNWEQWAIEQGLMKPITEKDFL